MTATRLIPLLSVRRGEQAVAFYAAAFGAQETLRIQEDPAGGIFSMLRIGDIEFWVSDEAPEWGNQAPDSLNGTTTRLVLCVDDPAAAHAQAIAAGATLRSEVKETHGWLEGGVLDPFGHRWTLAKQLA